jgi:hypothetical protein
MHRISDRPDNPAFLIAGIRLDTGFALPDIRPDTGFALLDIRQNQYSVLPF